MPRTNEDMVLAWYECVKTGMPLPEEIIEWLDQPLRREEWQH